MILFDGKTHTETFDILIDRKWHAGTLEVRSCGGVDCDTYHYPIVAKLGEILSVSKQILSLGEKKSRSKEAHQIRRRIWEADTKMDL